LWLERFGCSTFGDLKWWTGWTATQLRRALEPLEVVEVDLHGSLGLVGSDLQIDEAGEPWVALLPSLDPTPMGWKQRDWYRGDHQPHLFDRSGNIGPTVWVDGRIVGGWGQRPDGEIVIEYLEDVGADYQHLAAAEAARLRELIHPIAVKPSFPRPLQKRVAKSI
jgi:hypothetical protein